MFADCTSLRPPEPSWAAGSPSWRYKAPGHPPDSRPQRERGSSPATFGPREKKLLLAEVLKAHYRQFRKNLEQNLAPENSSEWAERLSRKHSLPEPFAPESGGASEARETPPGSALPIGKRLRSADEAAPPLRSSGLRPGARPFVPTLWSSRARKATNESHPNRGTDQRVLDERLGPRSPSSFDPSIVVDLFKLLQLTRHSHRRVRFLSFESGPRVQKFHSVRKNRFRFRTRFLTH